MTLSGPTIFFRADASLKIGTGHVMRCLALADALRRMGLACSFICRTQPNDSVAAIRHRGFAVHTLRPDEDFDGAETLQILRRSHSRCIVVDHYDLDERWERQIRSQARCVVVIDDLADRAHDCDVLVDQNLGRSADHYARLVPPNCRIFVGPRYALLRSEFAEWRDYSLRRRAAASLRRVFVSMGGTDQRNFTGRVLAALQHDSLSPDCRITVVLGQDAPWIREVRDQASRLPRVTEVVVNPTCVAEIMANSDLAIGAAGGTAWERCCLGLPTLLLVVAENQQWGANALVSANAAYGLGDPDELSDALPLALEAMSRRQPLHDMSLAASRLVDGLGAGRVCQQLGDLLEHS
jgi:UDP-2,4-diacetamido-2,4,6-trideoxy-beta-L-altropyranose hydrolase